MNLVYCVYYKCLEKSEILQHPLNDFLKFKWDSEEHDRETLMRVLSCEHE